MKYNLFLALICVPFLCFAQPGTLDNNFSADGYQTLNFGTSDYGFAGAVQPDQKILVCGYINQSPNRDIVVARLFPDGSYDSSFGTNGSVVFDNGGSNDVVNAIALQDDGKIVLAAQASSEALIIRLNSNGSLDNTFDFDGKLVVSIGTSANEVNDVKITSDNKIIACGSANDTGFPSNVAVVRLNADGSFDNTFSFDGMVTTDIDDNDVGYGLYVQSNGRITVVGSGGSSPMLVRYNSDGTLDDTFGTNGVVSLVGGTDTGALRTVIYDGTGRINVAGYFGPGSGNDVMVARLNYDGTLDNSFSSDGVAFFDYNGNTDDGTDFFIQPDGKLLVCGYGFGSLNTWHGLMLRYNADGTPDNSFGTNGVVDNQFTNSDRYWAIAMQADGKALAFGHGSEVGNTDILVARYITGLNIGIGEVDAYIGSTLIYPNPITNNQVTVEYELKMDEAVSIDLFDLTGKQITVLQPELEQSVGSYQKTLSLPALLAGNYFLKFNTEKGSVAVKLMVN